MTVEIKWINMRLQPTGDPDPGYPSGQDVDLSKGAPLTCVVELPYPTKGIGYYALACDTCGLKTLIGTTGLADEPRSAKLPCKRPTPAIFMRTKH